jgi:hypothetical protein
VERYVGCERVIDDKDRRASHNGEVALAHRSSGRGSQARAAAPTNAALCCSEPLEEACRSTCFLPFVSLHGCAQPTQQAAAPPSGVSLASRLGFGGRGPPLRAGPPFLDCRGKPGRPAQAGSWRPSGGAAASGCGPGRMRARRCVLASRGVNRRRDARGVWGARRWECRGWAGRGGRVGRRCGVDRFWCVGGDGVTVARMCAAAGVAAMPPP